MPNPVPRSYFGNRGIIDDLMDIARNEMIRTVTANLTGQMTAAVRAAVNVESSLAKFLGEAFDDAQFMGAYGDRFRKAHFDIGHAARRSIVDAYTHRRFRRPGGSYRIGDQRYAGGALRKALNSPQHVEATPTGLRFLDTTILDSEAKQWRRLNFGAGAGSSGGIEPPKQFNIEWDGLVTGTLGLPADPRPAFRLPPGYWLTPEGERVGQTTGVRAGRAARAASDQFFYAGSPGLAGRNIRGRPSRATVTQGIAASNFLDAGVRRVANEIGPAYLSVYSDIFEDHSGILNRIASRLGTSAPRGGEGVSTFAYYRRV